MQDLKGKTAFITGGARGIGRGMAHALGREGMQIMLADIDARALDVAVEALRAIGIPADSVQTDVTSRASLEAAAKHSSERFGKIHLVCNNAGVAVSGPLGALQPDDWEWVFNVNVRGVVFGMEVFVPILSSHGDGGHFVNTASLAGLTGAPGSEAYSGSKFAVVGMSEGWAQQLGPRNIGVSILLPGLVDTQIFASQQAHPEVFSPDPIKARRAKAAARAADDAIARAIEAGNIPDLRTAGLAPEIVGKLVVEGVQNEDLYIITHPHFRSLIAARFQRIMSAFDRFEKFLTESNDTGHGSASS